MWTRGAIVLAFSAGIWVAACASTDIRGTGFVPAGDSSIDDSASGLSTSDDGTIVDGGSVNASSGACASGAHQCNGLQPQVCGEGGWIDLGAACSFSCDPAAGCVGACTPNSKQCVGNGLQTCAAEGKWGPSQACPFVCTGGACAGVCVPGDKQCSGNTTQICANDGQWTSGTTCPNVCVNGACAGSCLPRSKQCSGNTPQTCSAGGAWTSGLACPFVCTGGACIGTCIPNDTQCSSSTQQQTCGADGKWSASVLCPFVCAGKACAGVCAPGDTKCASSTQEQTCSATGQWAATTTCPKACVGKTCGGQCVPDDTQCSSATEQQTCSSSGQWSNAMTCPVACVGKTCGCLNGTAVCTTGATKCSSGTQQTCDTCGQWTNATTCPFVCSGNACGGACAPNETRCETQTQQQTCGADGQWGTPVTCPSLCTGTSCNSTVSAACFPSATGVVGLDGPPDWTTAGVAAHPIAKQLDDPHWNGALRYDLPQNGGPTMPQAAFRGLQDGTTLYLSLREIVDPDGTTIDGSCSATKCTNDGVYLGFATATGAAKLVRFRPRANDKQDTADLAATAWLRPSGGAWGSVAVPAWIDTARVWTGSGTGASGAAWAVNLRVNIPVLQTDPDIAGTSFRMFAAVHDAFGTGLETTSVWPQGTSLTLTGDVPDATVDPASWGPMFLGTSDASCPQGVLLTPEHIGTMPIDANGIPSTQIQYGGGSGASNTFVAIMENPPSVGSVKANFRLADWGSQVGDSMADWKSILPAGAATPMNSDSAHPERITWTCHETAGASDSCPTLSGNAPAVQSLLVELSSVGGPSPVHFIQDSARRILDFVHASEFTRTARISIHGLAPLAGEEETRDVYLYVKTTNMPAVVPPRTTKAGRAAAKGLSVYQKTVFESLRDTRPTYEVHVYHAIGRKNGASEIVEAQLPFGYVVSHEGPLYGWRHRLEGQGVALDEIAPNLYRVKVPETGSVIVKTTIEAVEKAPSR